MAWSLPVGRCMEIEKYLGMRGVGWCGVCGGSGGGKLDSSLWMRLGPFRGIFLLGVVDCQIVAINAFSWLVELLLE